MADLLIVFDLSGLVHRAWHGQPWAAGRLALHWMVKIIEEREPTHVAAAVDRPWPTWRHDLCRDEGAVYKPPEKRTGGADRASIMGQCHIAETLAQDLLGMNVYGAKGFEGDDVVATLVQRFFETGGKVLVAARDKDFNQLVSPRVSLLDFSNGLVTRPEDVVGKFGVRPEQFADYLALVGDKTDGYLGCPGVGKKAAVEILERHVGVEAALAYAESVVCGGGLSQANRRKLLEGRAELERSLKLATLRTDAPLFGFRGVEDLRALQLPEGLA